MHFTTCVTCDGQVEVVDKGARSTLNLGGEKWNEGCAGKKKGGIPRERWRPPLFDQEAATRKSSS